MIVNRYRITMTCKDSPFAFDCGLVSATTEKRAVDKAKRIIKKCGLKPGKVIDIDIDSRFEI